MPLLFRLQHTCEPHHLEPVPPATVGGAFQSAVPCSALPVVLFSMPPKATTPLLQLNKSSAKLASWTVRATNGRIVHYSYTRMGKEVKQSKFEVHLVSTNESEYCIGYVKGPEARVQESMNRFQNQTVWNMSRVALDTYTAAANISTPVRVRVDLSKTLMQPNDDTAPADMPSGPAPPRSVASVAGMSDSCSCDLVALVKAVGLPRIVKDMTVADVCLIDGTRVDGHADLAEVVVGVFGTEKVAKLKDRVGKPMAFFNLSIQCGTQTNEGSRRITHWIDEFVQDAQESSKTRELLATAGEILGLSTESLTTTWQPSSRARDVSGPQPLSCAAFLDYTSDLTEADMPEVVQIMWVHLEAPAPDDVVTVPDTAAGSRIWFRTQVRDVSGCVDTGVSEKIALALTNCSNKEEFLQKHADGDLSWPILIHTRLSRSVRAPSGINSGASQPTAGSGASQPAGGSGSQAGPKFVNHLMEAAEPVMWDRDSAPNSSYESILGILNNCPAHNEGVVYAYLEDIRPDPQYGFKVISDGTPAPRSLYVAALVASGGRSTKERLDGSGYKVTTEHIKDIANPKGSPDQPVGDHTVTGFCTLDGVAGFDLAPPRGKKFRVAVAFFSRMDTDGEGTSLLLHGLQHIEPDAVESAIACMQRLRRLTMRVRPSSTGKRSHADAELARAGSEPPAKAARPRTLQRCATGGSLPEQHKD